MKKLKIIDKPTFTLMHPYSPISSLYVHGFLGQNFKRLDLGGIAGYLEKWISVRRKITLKHQQSE